MKNSGIYKITCLITNLIYIGYSKNLKSRGNNYKSNKIKTQKLIKKSIEEYEWENHKFEIIEYCEIEKLREREIYWINFYNTFNKGLNSNKGGGGPLTHTEKTKLKISKKSKLNKGKRINSHWKGKKKSHEICEKNRANKGKRAKSHRKGKNITDSHKLKISKSKKGKPIFSNRKCILQYDKNNNLIKEHDSIELAAKYINKNPTAINNALLKIKKGIKATSFGYIWKYKE